MGAQAIKIAQCMQCWRCVPEILGAQKSDEGGFLDKVLLVIVPGFFVCLFFRTVLFRYNLHTIRSTHFKCVIQ